jgi:triacylglycerol lipase
MLEFACDLSRRCYFQPLKLYLSSEIDNTLIIAFKGTTTEDEWVTNLDLKLVSMGNMGKVHQGFYEYFYETLKAKIVDLVKNTTNERVIFTGHSRGGGLATISALYIAVHFPHKQVECITFGSPKIGDERFKTFFNRYVSSSKRFVNRGDKITKMPPSKLFGNYVHVTPKTIITSDYYASHSIKTYCPCSTR